jgi:hypothetical protein
MNCPSCAAAMIELTLDGHLGTTVTIDLCAPCQVIWFDQRESLRLSPGATLRVFRTVGEGKQTSPPPLAPRLECPRCALRLLVTHDRQRNTPFRYWRCGKEHGRLITFFDFLREKNFVRPLSPAQLAELRDAVQMINCSNCGASIDLVHTSACAHCGTPISMLDLKQIDRTVAELQQQDEAASRTIDPMLTERLAREKREVERLFAALRDEGGGSSFGLVEVGLRLLTTWSD